MENRPTNSEAPIFGIDLGTTNSCIARLVDGMPVVIPIEGRDTVPSVVAYTDGEWMVGAAARNHARINPNEAAVSIKRKMEEPNSRVRLGEQEQSPIDISARILRWLADQASEATGASVSRVVITVPAWFRDTQRQATLAAGRQAGLEVLQIVNEPTAAALAYENARLAEAETERWLVYDLGGGTFDASVLSVSPSSHEVLASVGSCWLGGDDFDHRLVEKFVAHIRDCHNVDPSSDRAVMARLMVLAEDVKIRLSSETEVVIDEPVRIGDGLHGVNMTVSRGDFEGLVGDLIDSTVEKAGHALEEARISAAHLDRIILVGGSSRIPLVAERLRHRFGLEADSYVNADLSVVLGAVVQAAISTGRRLEQTVIDVSPHSLGIAVMGEADLVSEFESDREDPLTFLPLIRRNSQLPAAFTRTVYKAVPDQRVVRLAVYQGEAMLTTENLFVGAFLVDLPANDEKRLDVSFSYDINGIVKVALFQPGTAAPLRSYTMDVSRPDGDSDEDRLFREDVDEDSRAMEDDAEETATNYLIERVSSVLQEADSTTRAKIAPLLSEYRIALNAGIDDDVDVLEDQLYTWLESSSDTSAPGIEG